MDNYDFCHFLFLYSLNSLISNEQKNPLRMLRINIKFKKNTNEFPDSKNDGN